MAIYIEALGSISVLISACVAVSALVWHFRLLRKEEPGLPITDPFGAMNGAFVVLLVGVFVMSVYTTGSADLERRRAECRGTILYETLRDRDCRVVNAHAETASQVFTCATGMCYVLGDVLRCEGVDIALTCEDLEP